MDFSHQISGEEAAGHQLRITAVIDIGATAIRMAVAEIRPDRSVHLVDSLSQSVAIGQDTFRFGSIANDTIKRSIYVLRQYALVLKEYGIKLENVRAIATSAVREASNRDRFIDRIFIATGIQVKVIDEAEVIRLTYMGIQDVLQHHPEIQQGTSLITEIGGGVSKLIMVGNREVLATHSVRLGGLRLREMFENYGVDENRVKKLIGEPIRKSIGRIAKHFGARKCDALIALGGDIRFASDLLSPEERDRELVAVPVKELGKLARDIMDQQIEETARRYHLTIADAEVLGPTLLAYVELAKAYAIKEILSSKVSLRSGLLLEMAGDEVLSRDTETQIINAAVNLACKYDVDLEDARFVADASRMLFDALQPLHGMSVRYRLILYLGALLHEVGMFIASQSHHKHALYIIQNSNLFGLGSHDMLLIGLVARYHRRASPRPTHEGYAQLSRPERAAVSKMAAILRIADALDRSRVSELDKIEINIEDEKLRLLVPALIDVSMEQINIKQKSQLFEEVFGLSVSFGPQKKRYI